MKIPFNKPYTIGNEIEYIKKAVFSGKISGDGVFSDKCHEFFENRYRFKKVFLTTSCTDALEMAAILLDIQPGDEVILPSFTFVSTANAFALRGARLVFADSETFNPNIDVDKIESLISPKTKALVVVHYAGIACNMKKICEVVKKYSLHLVEDAAQAIDSYFLEKPLGIFGTFGTFSFHETKNIISGEGGLLCVNDEAFVGRAEIIREKGTNRSAFFRGEIDKYGWVDIGSSFLPSDIVAAYLFAQLEKIDIIQERRKTIWSFYQRCLEPLAKKYGRFSLPYIPNYATNNGHIFYLVCDSQKTRNDLIEHLKNKGIMAVFHYISLHKSQFYNLKHDGRSLPNSDRFSDCLVRLPIFYDISQNELEYIVDSVVDFLEKI